MTSEFEKAHETALNARDFISDASGFDARFRQGWDARGIADAEAVRNLDPTPRIGRSIWEFVPRRDAIDAIRALDTKEEQ